MNVSQFAIAIAFGLLLETQRRLNARWPRLRPAEFAEIQGMQILAVLLFAAVLGRALEPFS